MDSDRRTYTKIETFVLRLIPVEMPLDVDNS
jgi:hypothetical protein